MNHSFLSVWEHVTEGLEKNKQGRSAGLICLVKGNYILYLTIYFKNMQLSQFAMSFFLLFVRYHLFIPFIHPFTHSYSFMSLASSPRFSFLLFVRYLFLVPVMVALTTGIIVLVFASMYFWVWGILRKRSACAPTACKVVRD
jgi:hypothetical protein